MSEVTSNFSTAAQPQSDSKGHWLIAIASIGTFAWLPFFMLQQALHGAKILNNKDLPPFVGEEHGSMAEYLLNVWHWDAVGFALILIALPSFITLVGLLMIDRRTSNP